MIGSLGRASFLSDNATCAARACVFIIWQEKGIAFVALMLVALLLNLLFSTRAIVTKDNGNIFFASEHLLRSALRPAIVDLGQVYLLIACFACRAVGQPPLGLLSSLAHTVAHN